MAVATTFNVGRTVLVVASLDGDWSYTTDFPSHSNGVRIHSIQFIPSGEGDRCMLRDQSGTVATGPEIFYAASPNRFATKYFDGKWVKPAYDVSDSNNVCNASASAKIIFVIGGYLD